MERVKKLLNKVIKKDNSFRQEHPVWFLLIVTFISFGMLWLLFLKIPLIDFMVYLFYCIFKFISGFWNFINGDYYMERFIVPSLTFIMWLLWIFVLWIDYGTNKTKDKKNQKIWNEIFYKTKLFIHAVFPMFGFLLTFTINLFVSFYIVALDYEVDIIIGYMILMCIGIYIRPRIIRMWKKHDEIKERLNKIKDSQDSQKIERENEYIKFFVNEVNFKIEMELKIITFVIGVLISNSLLFNSNENFINICVLADNSSCTVPLVEVILTMSFIYVYMIILKVIGLLDLKEGIKSDIK